MKEKRNFMIILATLFVAALLISIISIVIVSTTAKVFPREQDKPSFPDLTEVMLSGALDNNPDIGKYDKAIEFNLNKDSLVIPSNSTNFEDILNGRRKLDKISFVCKKDNSLNNKFKIDFYYYRYLIDFEKPNIPIDNITPIIDYDKEKSIIRDYDFDLKQIKNYYHEFLLHSDYISQSHINGLFIVYIPDTITVTDSNGEPQNYYD